MKHTAWLFLAPILFLPLPLHAPGWLGIIDPDRAIDWSNTGVGATIINRTTQCGPTINAYGGTATSINNALASCNNGYVLLGPGIFTLSTGINFGTTNNVTLRGSGPTQTIINFTGGGGCGGHDADICAINSTQIWAGGPEVQYGTGSNTAYWTAGFSQGARQIMLSSTVGLSVGMTIFLDQADDAGDTRGVYECQAYGPCAADVPSGAGRPGRLQMEMKQITAIIGNIVGIAPGLYNTNWRAVQTPGAWWVGPMLTGVGIEDLTANHNGNSAGGSSGIFFNNCHNCWMRNVRSLYASRNHVWCWQSSNITVRDSYFYGSQTNNDVSYGVEHYGCANVLTENNIAEHMPFPFTYAEVTGSVLAYNFGVDQIYATPSWNTGTIMEHAGATNFNLIEGNQGSVLVVDNYHGTHDQETYFRNWLSGRDIDGQVNDTVPVVLYAVARGYNLLGNVLGTPGYHTNYEDRFDLGTTANGNNSVYVLGFCTNPVLISISACVANGSILPNDSLTPATLFRWGNYDAATGTVHWMSNEVPTTGDSYLNGNPVPASQTLPASFYLTSQPSWWGLMPWPAIGPDVTGGPGPGGHAYAIPAAMCYNATPRDSSGVLQFDANACYQPLRRFFPTFL